MTKTAEVHALIVRWQDEGDIYARDRALAMYLPLVGSMLRRYKGAKHPAVRDDAVIVGTMALLHALNKFDRTKGVAFGIYARMWIRAYVLQLLSSERQIVSHSKAARSLFMSAGRAQRALHREGIEATPEAIGAYLKLKITPDEVAQQLALLTPMPSLDAPASRSRDTQDKETTYGERFADTSPLQDERLIEASFLRASTCDVHMAVQRLDPRLQQLVKLRYLAEEPMPLRAVGEKIGVSGERVRQLELIAMRELRRMLAHYREEVA